MSTQPEDSRWLGPSLLEPAAEHSDTPNEFERLWRGFMTARVTIGLVLLLLHGGSVLLDQPHRYAPLLISGIYFAAALTVRLLTTPQQLSHVMDAHWLRTVGIDVLAFATLQMLQDSQLNYAPLLALPALMAAMLGPMVMALGTAAGITLLLFGYAGWLSVQTPWDSSVHFLQAALTGAGCFAISVLASQIAARLSSLKQSAQRNQLAAAVQRQVNALVIESLAEGVLVVDRHGLVRSANPAARLLLDTRNPGLDEAINLTRRSGWQALLDLVQQSFRQHGARRAEIVVNHAGQGPRQLLVRTQLTDALKSDTHGLCVVFLQDQRELQARVRTEKLASLGRMSAAIAHEIRNPLAAITQANGLLAEDLHDPSQQRLTRMVQQNALRLDKIVSDVLQLARAPSGTRTATSQLIDLSQSCERICRDWKNQNGISVEFLLGLPADGPAVWFDPEHLRRVLINLLDNAYRYASHQSACVQISTEFHRAGAPQFEAMLRVWSDGAPLDPSVEHHLFEPFFSSESRSSGLGLYICRELCDSHGATIAYRRNERLVQDHPVPGNEFHVRFSTRPLDPALT